MSSNQSLASNGLDQTFWLSKPPKKLEKQFKKHAIPVFPINSSIPIELDGEKYYIVGNGHDYDYVFYPLFDIYREDGTIERDEGKAQFIHKTVAILRACTALEVVSTEWGKQGNSLPQKHKVVENVSSNLSEGTDLLDPLIELFQDQKKYQELLSFQKMMTIAKKVKDKQNVNKEDAECLIQEFKQFWKEFQCRAKHLYLLFEINPSLLHQCNMIEDSPEKEWLLSVAKESGYLHPLFFSFSDMMSNKRETRPFSSDLLTMIDWHYQLMRSDRIQINDVKLSKLEQVIYPVFKWLMAFCKWFVIPVALLGFLVTGFNFAILVFPGLFLFLYLPIYRQFSKRLKIKLYYRYVESHLYKHLKDDNIKQDDYLHTETMKDEFEPFEVTGSTINESVGIILFAGLPMTVLGLYFVLIQGKSLSGIEGVFVFGGLAITIFSVIMPYLKMSQRTLRFKEQYVIYNRNEVWPQELINVTWKPESKALALETINKVTYKFVLNKDQIPGSITKVKEWAEGNNVPFEIDEK
ncbi:hypothetical protein [Alteribacter populi]|uniref:hypothetical protein n=1 Tax=Alteribacter populi TaxID=2011011 RepID=UPI000BBA67D9|nr:hypothetical protein [Alteribacter populi]